MKKSSITLIILSIIGAGALGYWQISKKSEVTPLETTSTKTTTRTSTQVPPQSSLIPKITDSSLRWEVRVDILRRLDADNLSSAEIDTLYGLLNHTPAIGQEENWWVVVNEIMEQMRKQAIGADRYTPAMLSIIRDGDAPEVLRDYAIQHLSQWVTPRGADQGASSETNESYIQEAAQAFGSIITDATLAHTSIPGTALMVLTDMKHGGASESAITSVIDSLQPWLSSTISGKNNVSKITRISAINAIGMLALPQHAPIIRQLAESDTTDPSIRLNSIATLGSIGTAEDLTTLETIASSETRYRHAATAALKKLSLNTDH